MARFSCLVGLGEPRVLVRETTIGIDDAGRTLEAGGTSRVRAQRLLRRARWTLRLEEGRALERLFHGRSSFFAPGGIPSVVDEYLVGGDEARAPRLA